MSALTFRLLGQTIRFQPAEQSDKACIQTIFGAFAVVNGGNASPDLAYRIVQDGDGYIVELPAKTPARTCDLCGLAYLLEQDVTVRLQERRADLLFLHAAVVEWQGRALVLAADSGGGKSTTTWWLLHNGFGYLSDELCPIDLASNRVLPYPHALCLKHRPAGPHELPVGTLDLGRTLHVPTHMLPGPVLTTPHELSAVFLLSREFDTNRTTVQRVSSAEAATRIYVAALNALAHPDRGMPAALRVAMNLPCYRLNIGNFSEACEVIRSTVESAAPCSSNGC